MKSSRTGGSETRRCSNEAESTTSFPYTRLFPHLHQPSAFNALNHVSSLTTTSSPIASGALLLASNFLLQRDLIPRFRLLSMDGSVENAVRQAIASLTSSSLSLCLGLVLNPKQAN